LFVDNIRCAAQKFGTPSEDAQRRDATINALFYNVHTRLVEDHTSRGVSDLQEGVIRTPLAPFQTLLDDPLRMLRYIRSASRFGFTLDEGIAEAVKDKRIRDSFQAKISRERVGVEILKMLKGRLFASVSNVILHWSLRRHTQVPTLCTRSN
jgi:tRNA nucleotidyltransferase (CCA-adding enzyme)